MEEDEDTDEWMLVGILVGWALGRQLFGSSDDLVSFWLLELYINIYFS